MAGRANQDETAAVTENEAPAVKQNTIRTRVRFVQAQKQYSTQLCTIRKLRFVQQQKTKPKQTLKKTYDSY